MVNIIVYGFCYVFESLLRFCWLLWLLMFMGVMGIYIYLVKESVDKYYLNLVSIEFLEVIFEKGELMFFVVIICNLNWFVKMKINMFESDENFCKMDLNFLVCEVVKMVNKNMICG